MKKTKLSVSYTDNTLVVKFGKSVISWEITRGAIVRTKNMAPDTDKKELDGASYLSKFVADYMPKMKGTWKSKIMKMALALNDLIDTGVATFRTLNNNIRKHYDDGSDAFWKSHFYEGNRKGHGVRELKAAA